jgi:phenylpropionate dioxygenase-like ring-hydroxylating dioxygenase large terminal subunit
MTEPLRSSSNRCPGPSYQDVVRSDGGHVPDVLQLQSNPPQSTADIGFERYTSRAFFDREMAKMWRKVWQFACREEHVAEVGDYFVHDIGRHSILIVRTDAGLKAYHNSCLHRGTKLKPSGSNGWSEQIQCPFHGWTWRLDGTMKTLPCQWDFPHVDRARMTLPEVLVDSWNGFVFINMDRGAKPLLDYLEVLPEHFARWDMTGWYVHAHVRKRLPGNWKLAQEAFMEAYHTPVAHPQLTHVVGDINMQHDVFSPHVSRDLCLMAVSSPTVQTRLTEQELLDRMLVGDTAVAAEKALVPEGRTARWVMARQLREAMARDHGLDFSGFSDSEMVDSIKYNVFPNLLLFPSIGFRLVQLFRPDGMDPDRSIYDVMILRPKNPDGTHPDVAEVQLLEENESYTSVSALDPFLAQVLDEDTDIMRWQREGMYASEKGAETLSRYQESRIRHLHDTLDRYLGA